MDFNLTDVHQEFINLAAGFGKKKLAPTITERDHQGIFDEDLVSEMLGLGLCGAYFEEKYNIPTDYCFVPTVLLLFCCCFALLFGHLF